MTTSLATPGTPLSTTEINSSFLTSILGIVLIFLFRVLVAIILENFSMSASVLRLISRTTCGLAFFFALCPFFFSLFLVTL